MPFIISLWYELFIDETDGSNSAPCNPEVILVSYRLNLQSRLRYQNFLSLLFFPDKEPKRCPNTTITATTKETNFNDCVTQLVNHWVTWSNALQLTSVASSAQTHQSGYLNFISRIQPRSVFIWDVDFNIINFSPIHGWIHFFLFATASRPVPGAAPAIQWIMGFFLQGQSGWGMKLTIDLQKLRMGGALCPTLHMFSWRCAYFIRGQLQLLNLVKAWNRNVSWST